MKIELELKNGYLFPSELIDCVDQFFQKLAEMMPATCTIEVTIENNHPEIISIWSPISKTFRGKGGIVDAQKIYDEHYKECAERSKKTGD